MAMRTPLSVRAHRPLVKIRATPVPATRRSIATSSMTDASAARRTPAREQFLDISSGSAGLEHLQDVQQQQSGTTFMRGATIEGRVMVVEDDDAIRMMLLTVLEVEGYEALGVRNGIDALAMLGEWRPDVIVLDLFM